MTTNTLGSTKLNDQMILDLVRKILQAPDYRDSERVERQVGEFLVRYLKGEISFLRAQSELKEDFPVEF